MKKLFNFVFIFLFITVNAQQIETKSVTIDKLIEFVVSDINTIQKTNLTLLVETKSNTVSSEKIFFLKQSVALLAKRIPVGSKISLVTYNKVNGLVIKPTPIAKINSILTQTARFKIQKDTEAFGIDLAHEYAKENYIENGENIIIMVRDGDNFVVKNRLKEPIHNTVKTGTIISAIGLLPELINAIKD